MSEEKNFQKSSFTDVSDAAQLALLNAQLAYAREKSAYYRTVLPDTQPLTSLTQLRTLPFLTAEKLAGEGTALCCVSAAEIARIVTLRSSGTAGAPKRLFFTAQDLARTVEFFREGMGWMCVPGDRVGIFLPGTSPDGLCDLLSRGLTALGAAPTVFGEVADAAAMAARVRIMQPEVLIGMPWQMRALSLALPGLRPKAVLLSADFVPQALLAFLAERWGCPVLTHYGLTESGFGFAVQHPCAAGMYYRRSDFVAEVVDPVSGAPLPSGAEGELVITTLRREAMPLIRYRTGDRAVMNDEKKIARVPGRLGIADEFYDLQERLAPLPWLLDYAAADEGVTAHVTAEAPEDCAAQLSAITGMEKILCKLKWAMLHGGKRI